MSRKRGEKLLLVPAEPLARQLRLAGREFTTGPLDGMTSGFQDLRRKYELRFGGTEADRQIHRILRPQAKITFETADRWCCVLGIHPVMLWPELYREAA